MWMSAFYFGGGQSITYLTAGTDISIDIQAPPAIETVSTIMDLGGAQDVSEHHEDYGMTVSEFMDE
jgi:hypothetical protein